MTRLWRLLPAWGGRALFLPPLFREYAVAR
jgi:hypothetical protein